MTEKLTRAWYERPTIDVARGLLGKVIVRLLEGDVLAGRIVETEAYCGASDPGSHAFRGQTERNRVMFGPGGYLYVYFTYGMHFCMNVVSEQSGMSGAALVRALEPLKGAEHMRRLRGDRPTVELCNGPAKLCQALAVTRALNGLDLTGDKMWIEDDGFPPPDIVVTSRVGLSAGQDRPWRFLVAGSPFVSPGKPSLSRDKVATGARKRS